MTDEDVPPGLNTDRSALLTCDATGCGEQFLQSNGVVWVSQGAHFCSTSCRDRWVNKHHARLRDT